MKVIDAVVRFDIGFSSVLTERSIQFVEKFGQPMRVGSNEHIRLDDDIRKVSGVSLYNLVKPQAPEDICKLSMFTYIAKELLKYSLMYRSKFSYLELNGVNQIDILKYSENGKYTAHVDDGHDSNRTTTIILNLNDDYEGGDFIFFNPVKKNEIIHREKLKKGSLLFFPSNFLYAHSVEPITKGTRYSIVSWMA
mgnify:CR=1 FL=1